MAEMEILRTPDDVARIMVFAKLENDDFKKPVQCLSFDTELDNECVQLIEVDSDILKELKEGSSVAIRGRTNDSAVLCTASKTYDLKLAETSNTMLLLPDLKLPDELGQPDQPEILHNTVVALKYTYYELKPMRARVKRLQQLLEENEYRGWEYENDETHGGKKYTFDELQQEVQASAKEIYEAFKVFRACEIDGCWRILDFMFTVQVVEEIFKLIDEQSWTVDNIPLSECGEILGQLYPRNVVEHVLKCFADPSESDPSIYALTEDKICRLYAEIILKPSEKFQLDEFLTMWQESVPYEMKTGLYQLEGMALVDLDSRPSAIWYFPTTRLPENIEERFNFLFKEKSKWTLDEITPFVIEMKTSKLSVGAMLMKFARACSKNSIKVYTSKKLS